MCIRDSNAVAVLVNNPTYYGICSDLRAIVKMAHDAGMLCLCLLYTSRCV